MRIDGFPVGEKTFCIAEICGNHGGDFDKARRLLHLAAESGADAVKFQTYKAEKYIDPAVPTMAHVRGVHKTQLERFKSLQFSRKQWRELARLAREQNVIFFSTPADHDSADMLDELVPVFKIQSGDVTNIPLIRHVAAKGKPIIMSTGMASEEEIAAAVREVPADRLALLHCVSAYPTPPDKICLGAIPALRERFGLPTGYSDHSMNSLACLAAVACGAVIIERHFTDDKDQPIGDHKFSAAPDEFKTMVENIREIEVMRGGFQDRLSEAETGMRRAMRRGLAMASDVAAGTVLTPEALIAIRPEQGVSPAAIDRVVGKKAARDLKRGEFPEPSDIEGFSS